VADPRAELIEAFYDAGARGDIDAGWEMVAPDVVFDWSRSRGPQKGVYRGRKEARRFLDTIEDAWSDIAWFTEELISCDRGVIRVGGLRAKGRSSGVEIEATGAQLIEVEEGRISRITLYQSKEEALGAVGFDPAT
jgi:ketosteroid isomerase-like protein